MGRQLHGLRAEATCGLTSHWVHTISWRIPLVLLGKECFQGMLFRCRVYAQTKVRERVYRVWQSQRRACAVGL